MIRILLINFLFIFNLSAEVIKVTAEKITNSPNQTTSSITVITEDDIKQSQKTKLNDLLQEQAGININSNGAFGKTSSLFLRGGDSSFTLVVIDGVEYTDRSSVGGSPLYEYLSLNNIKQIEVLKGSQSVLYGSDALSGVIRITTKDAGIEDGNLTVSYGTHENKSFAANSQGKGKYFDYSMGLFIKDVEGISSFNENRTVQAEKDGYSNLTGQLKLEKKIKDSKFQFNIMGIKAKSEFDSTSSDRTENIAKDDQYLISLSYSGTFSEYFSPMIRFSQNKSDRLNAIYSTFSSSTNIEQLTAKTNRYELQNISYFDQFSIIQGLEFEDIQASITNLNNQKIHKSYAAFFNLQKNWQRLNLQLGTRFTEERDYDAQIVWKAGARYQLIHHIAVKTNASTGFKSPSLYQLHSSSGNENLRPTESKSYDLGFELRSNDHLVELSYFKNIFTNLIDFDSATSSYANTFKSETSGIEFLVNSSFESWSYGFNANWLKAINKTAGKVGNYLARRPREKYNINIDKKINKINLGLDARYVGQREDSDFNDVVLSSFFTADLRFAYELNEFNNLNLWVGNILDKDYEQVNGYGSLGRTYQFTWRSKL